MMRKLVTQLHKEVIEYFASTDPSQISHTEAVHNFSQLLSQLENYDEHRLCLVEMSALLHDIGCPNAQLKYGNTKAPNQEKEGELLASEMLTEYPMEDKDKQLISEVVGLHHHHKSLQEMGFDVLVEADLIVNMLEGYYKPEQAKTLFENMVTTESGKSLYRNMFLK